MFFISYSTTSTIPEPWKNTHSLSYMNTAFIHSFPMITFCVLFFLISIILPYINSTSNFFLDYSDEIHLTFVLITALCLLTFLVFYLYRTNTFFDTERYNIFINDYIDFQNNNKNNLSSYDNIKISNYDSIQWNLFNSEESFSQLDLIDSKLTFITPLLNSIQQNTAISYVNLEQNLNSLNINYENSLTSLCYGLMNSLHSVNSNYLTSLTNEIQQMNNVPNNNYSKAINTIEECKNNLNEISSTDNYLNSQPYSNPRGIFSKIFIPTISYINTPTSSYNLTIDQNCYLYFDNTKPFLYIDNNLVLAPLNKIINNLVPTIINFGTNTISVSLNSTEYINVFTNPPTTTNPPPPVVYSAANYIIFQGAGVNPYDDTFLYPTLILIPTNSGIYTVMCQYSVNLIKNVILLTPFNQIYKFVSLLNGKDLSSEFSVNPINNIYETNFLYNYVKNIQLTTNVDLSFQEQFYFLTQKTTNNLQVLSFPISCSSYLTNYSLYAHFEITQYPDKYNIYLYYGLSTVNSFSKIKNNYLRLECSLVTNTTSPNVMNVNCYKKNSVVNGADILLNSFTVSYS